jgi:1-aminocyclopropane-1-carboxylate deaminase
VNEAPRGLDDLPHRLPSPLREVRDERLARHGVRVWLKRDDLIHPEIVGNKFRKLRLNLRDAAERGHRTLLTFGGAYSNHLRAVAAAGRLLGFETIGVVRGEELAERPLNASLARAAADGMRLHFVDRATYRRKNEAAVLDGLARRFARFHPLPEGGSNALAAAGCVPLGRELRGLADVVALACGTGGTLAGLAAGLDPERQRAIGFPVLKGGAFLADEVERLQDEAFGGPRGRWELECGFHAGGYARTDAPLREFTADFARRHAIAPDPVYVAKMLHGVWTLTEEGAFPPGTRIAAVVTG